jgi:hypothetical protein
MIVSLVAPFSIGSIFKYFLLVPMPTEGLIVAVMDASAIGISDVMHSVDTP